MQKLQEKKGRKENISPAFPDLLWHLESRPLVFQTSRDSKYYFVLFMLPALFSLFFFLIQLLGRSAYLSIYLFYRFSSLLSPLKCFFTSSDFFFLNLVVSVPQGNQGRTGVVVAAYMHYSNISARYLIKSCSISSFSKLSQKVWVQSKSSYERHLVVHCRATLCTPVCVLCRVLQCRPGAGQVRHEALLRGQSTSCWPAVTEKVGRLLVSCFLTFTTFF